MGSVGAKVNEILAGRAEAYVHDTGFFEWDVAAPAGVAARYGLVATHVDGTPLAFNAMPPYVHDLVVAHPRCTRCSWTRCGPPARRRGTRERARSERSEPGASEQDNP